MNICRFSHLKCLIVANCIHLEDVSALDGIHELRLIRCPNIHNISRLKHNYKIEISSCFDIHDYRGSCQFSTIIQIDSTSSNIDSSIRPSSLQNVKSLQLQGNNSFQTIHGYLPIESCLNLRFVSIISYKYYFLLPSNHNIKELIVEQCAKFESCMNMRNITKISLRYLENLKNLNGLEDTSDINPSNSYRSIEVNSCPNITNFTPLQSYQKISIFHCKGFSDTKIFPNVKEFHLKPYPNIIFNDYLYVTHLIFNFPPNNLQYKKLNQVQVIEINHSTDALIDFIMDVQRYLHHIQKIVLTKHFLPIAHFDQEKVLVFIYERVGLDFIIQEERTSGELILLRKKKVR